MSIDPTTFLKGLDLADKIVRRAAVKGMRQLAAAGEERAKVLVPIETGTLAGTIRSEVSATETRVEGRIVAGGGEASDYAIVQHEAELHHTHPVEGTYASKYVETPIKELTPKAASFLAEKIRNELNG